MFRAEMPASTASSRWPWVGASLLLFCFAALATFSLRVKSVTGDEVAHLPSGYTYVKTGDFRLNRQHPPLIKGLAGLPLLALDLDPIEGAPGWEEADEWRFGKDFLLDNSASMERILFLGRLPMVGIGVLLGLLLFMWARELYTPAIGLAVLLLYCFSPNMLAHTRFVTTDVGVACFTVMALFCLWKFVRGGNWWWAVACGVGVGLALLAKYSGVVTLGLVAILLGLVAIDRWVRGRSRRSSAPTPPPTNEAYLPVLARLTLAGIAVLGLALAIVWVGFGFPHGLSNYKAGFDLIYADHNPDWQGFLWGEYSSTGFRHYYLLAHLWKTPLPTLILLGWVFLVVPRKARLPWLDAAFIVVPILAFSAAGIRNQANIGIRHVLPVYPFLFLLCGLAVVSLRQLRVGYRALFALLCLGYVVGTFRAYPHFLPYFNVLAGGPDGGIHYLDDSNIDWGQDFYLLRDYLDRTRPQELKLFAFSGVPPQAYGIDSEPITFRDVVWPRPGVTYVVSAHFLQRSSLYDDVPDFRFHWLDRYEPAHKVGWSLFVYRFHIDEDSASPTQLSREEWYGDAVSRLRELLQRSPDFEPAGTLLVTVLDERGLWRIDEGREAEGLDDLLQSLLIDPANPEVRQHVIRHLAQREAPRPDVVADAQFVEGIALQRAGNLGEALVALLDCIAQQPDHVLAHHQLGRIYARAGLGGLALGEWETCLSIEPEFAPARRDLQQLLEARRRTERRFQGQGAR